VIDDILPLNSSDSERTNHPTQKPMRLYEYFIKTYTHEKMIVLDCFSGSNVVAVSCLNLKRNWISIELEEKYISMGLERLRQYFNHGISIKNHSVSFGVIYSFIKPLDFIVQREQAKQKVSK
jgi:DNA modification methylase